MTRAQGAAAFTLATAAGLGLTSSGTTAQAEPEKSATVVSSDGVLEFTTNPGEGTVTVRDVLNKLTMSESLVCPDPRGAVLTRDEVSLLVACHGSAELVFLNTASFEVVARVAHAGGGVSGVRLSSNGRFAQVVDENGLQLSEIDIDMRRLAGIPAAVGGKGPRPSSAGAGGRGGVRGTARPAPSASAARPLPAGGSKNQLVFIGTLHGEHRTSRRFGLDVLRRLIAVIGPDFVLTEIPPNRLERASDEFAARGRIAEPRVSRFPEYVDVLFPMLPSSGFRIIGTAAWNQPMDRYRRGRLAAIERDPTRTADWAEYQRAVKASEAAIEAGGASDDPRWIHTDAYDAAQRIQLDVYNRLFDQELGTGGWDTINKAHFANITRVLDEHSGAGVRFLVTYGAGHKSWMLPRLRARADLDVLDISKFLDAAGVEWSAPR